MPKITFLGILKSLFASFWMLTERSEVNIQKRAVLRTSIKLNLRNSDKIIAQKEQASPSSIELIDFWENSMANPLENPVTRDLEVLTLSIYSLTQLTFRKYPRVHGHFYQIKKIMFGCRAQPNYFSKITWIS